MADAAVLNAAVPRLLPPRQASRFRSALVCSSLLCPARPGRVRTARKLAPLLSLSPLTARTTASGFAYILGNGGAGHTAIIHTRRERLQLSFAQQMAASRVLVNGPGCDFAQCLALGHGVWHLASILGRVVRPPALVGGSQKQVAVPSRNVQVGSSTLDQAAKRAGTPANKTWGSARTRTSITSRPPSMAGGHSRCGPVGIRQMPGVAVPL